MISRQHLASKRQTQWILLITFGLLQENFLTQANYNPQQQYATNLLPTLTRLNGNTRHIVTKQLYNPQHHHHSPQHHHHHHHLHSHHRQLSKSIQSLKKPPPYLTRPFINNHNQNNINNYNGNLLKKPTPYNYDDILVYNNKRYKRYPPYQAVMPEIPINKALGRYLPYTPLYPINFMHGVTPNLLLPLYIQPSITPVDSAASRYMLKPTRIKPTLPTVINKSYYNINNIPTNDMQNHLLINYLRLLNATNNNNNKANYQNVSKKGVDELSSSFSLSSLWHNDNSSTTTTTTDVSTTYRPMTSSNGASRIKFHDLPYSESSVRQQRTGGDINEYNKNSQMSTIFHFPIIQDKLLTTPTTSSTTITPSLYQTTRLNKQKVDGKNENQFEFVPTWYPQTVSQRQQHKYNNFFTIEDAIIPSKTNDPIVNFHAYQPFSYDVASTEQPISEYAGFSPLQDIYHNAYALSPLPSLRTTTTEASITTGASTTTVKPTTTNTPTVEVKEHTEIHNQFKMSTVGGEKGEEGMHTNARDRLRSNNEQITHTPSTTTKPKKKNYSFFDDWFGGETTDTSSSDMLTTAAPTTTIATKPSKESFNLKSSKYDIKVRRTKANSANSVSTTTTTTTTHPSLTNEPSAGAGLAQKLRKKYVSKNKNQHDNHNNRHQTMKLNNLNSTTFKDNNKILTKRIKKIKRLRSTLTPLIKLKNNSLIGNHKSWIKTLEEEDEQSQTRTSTTTRSMKNDQGTHDINDEIEMKTTIASSVSTTTTTTSTTTQVMPLRGASEKSRGGSRKRGRFTFNNQQLESQQQLQQYSANLFGDSNAKHKQEINIIKNRGAKPRITHLKRSGQSTTTKIPLTTRLIATHQTVSAPNDNLEFGHLLKWPASSTAESAIMKIATNSKQQTINSILHNLQLTPTPVHVQLGTTEFPPLPIELYFQKMTKSTFK